MSARKLRGLLLRASTVVCAVTIVGAIMSFKEPADSEPSVRPGSWAKVFRSSSSAPLESVNTFKNSLLQHVLADPQDDRDSVFLLTFLDSTAPLPMRRSSLTETLARKVDLALGAIVVNLLTEDPQDCAFNDELVELVKDVHDDYASSPWCKSALGQLTPIDSPHVDGQADPRAAE